jgi:ABC-type sugar transport system substrate-binding protein
MLDPTRSPRHRTHRILRILVPAVGITAALILSACSSSKSTNNTNGGGSTTSGGTNSAIAGAKANFDRVTGPYNFTPPGDPVVVGTSLKGKSIWKIDFIPIPIIQAFTTIDMGIAQQFGATFHSCNANAQAAAAAACITQALNAHADVIITDAMPAQLAGPSIQKIKDSGTKLLYADVGYTGDAMTPNYAEFATDQRASARDAADGLIVKLNGKANILAFYISDIPENVAATQAADGSAGEVKKNCPSCSFDSVGLASPDIANWAAKIGAALIAHPNVNAILAEVDPMVTAVLQAIKTTGRKVTVVSGSSAPTGLAAVKKGDLYMEVGTPVILTAYAQMDQVIRMVLGKTPITKYPNATHGFTTDTAQSLTIDQPTYVTGQWYNIDPKTLYDKNWGVS